MKNLMGWFIAVVLVIFLYNFLRPFTESNSQKLMECRKVAGEIYDSSRRTITRNENGYSKQEQQMFYERTEAGYANDLGTCDASYGK